MCVCVSRWKSPQIDSKIAKILQSKLEILMSKPRFPIFGRNDCDISPFLLPTMGRGQLIEADCVYAARTTK